MKNSLCDLNDHLFSCLESLMNDDLSGEQLQREIDRAKAVNSVAHSIIENAGTQIEAMKLREAIIENNGKGELPEMLIPKDTSSGRRLIEAQK